jgi:hypothetical protein
VNRNSNATAATLLSLHYMFEVLRGKSVLLYILEISENEFRLRYGSMFLLHISGIGSDPNGIASQYVIPY